MKNLLITPAILMALAIGSTVLTTACSVTGGQQRTGAYVDDAALTGKVKAKLAADDKVSAGRINVETLNSTVQLSGFANSAEEKARAVELTQGVSGVKSVRDDIIVRPAQ